MQSDLNRKQASGASARGCPDVTAVPQGRARTRGFSLIEILVVMAVMLVVAAFAIPTLTTTMDGFRLRGAINSASTLTQRMRAEAIRNNTTQRLHFTTVAGKAVLFATDLSDPATAPVAGDTQLHGELWLPQQVTIPATPATTLTGPAMWGSSVTPRANQDIYFSSRGMPCWTTTPGGICSPTSGFVYYFKYSGSGTRWAALSVSPAGRIESWFWNGTAWGN